MTSGFNYQEELSKCSTMEDITGPNGLVQRMVKDAIEQILQSEITDYITDEKSKGNTLTLMSQESGKGNSNRKLLKRGL